MKNKRISPLGQRESPEMVGYRLDRDVPAVREVTLIDWNNISVYQIERFFF